VVAVGSYISIYGTGLSLTGSVFGDIGPFAHTLNGTQLSLGGIPMPLFYASGNQVNALVPPTGSNVPIILATTDPVTGATSPSNSAAIGIQ